MINNKDYGEYWSKPVGRAMRLCDIGYHKFKIRTVEDEFLEEDDDT